MNRRQFLSSATVLGTAVLLITPKAKAVSGCGAADAANANLIRGESLIASSVGCLLFSHTHELEIPLLLLKNPPATGVTLRTNRIYAHSHNVTLTQKNLIDVAAGQTVVVTDSLNLEHQFTIQLPH